MSAAGTGETAVSGHCIFQRNPDHPVCIRTYLIDSASVMLSSRFAAIILLPSPTDTHFLGEALISEVGQDGIGNAHHILAVDLVHLQPATADELAVRLAAENPEPEAVLLPMIDGLPPSNIMRYPEWVQTVRPPAIFDF